MSGPHAACELVLQLLQTHTFVSGVLVDHEQHAPRHADDELAVDLAHVCQCCTVSQRAASRLSTNSSNMERNRALAIQA